MGVLGLFCCVGQITTLQGFLGLKGNFCKNMYEVEEWFER